MERVQIHSLLTEDNFTEWPGMIIYVYLQGVSYMTEWADLDQKTLNQSIIFCIFLKFML